jgi:N4-gp56 family major capsid protein
MSGQLWVTNAADGYLASPKLSKVLRNAVQPQCKFRQFADVKDAAIQGKGKGDTFHWDVFSDVITQGTTLTETNTMPETNYTVTQGTMTIGEQGNSVPYSGKLDDLSELPVKEIINKALKNDATKCFDILTHTEFNKTELRVTPTNGTATDSVVLTTNGTAGATNNVGMLRGHIKAIVDMMKERNLPAYSGDDYMSIGHPSTFRPFKNDLEAVRQYSDTGFGMIMNSEIGRYENCRFTEQTNIPKGGAADSTTWDPNTKTADPWNNGLSSWAFFFGDDAIAEGVAVPEEMRGKIPTDFGRSKGIAWYAECGYALVHKGDIPNQRVIKWDSAA